MKRIAKTIIAAMLCWSAIASGEVPCTGQQFGQHATHTCDRAARQCGMRRAYIPPEVLKIRAGAVLGGFGFIGHGPATWLAVDIDNERAIDVQRYCGSNTAYVPQFRSQSSSNYTKTVRLPNGTHCVDHVRIRQLSDHQVATLACVVNPLWSASIKPYENWGVTDTGSQFFLLLPRSARYEQIAGVFTGPIAAFGAAVEKYFSKAGMGAHDGSP